MKKNIQTMREKYIYNFKQSAFEAYKLYSN